jgi:alpha-N-arabinofuranosidase
VHHDATFLPLDLQTDRCSKGGEDLPAVSATASRDAQGTVHVSLVNLDPVAPVAVAAEIEAGSFRSVAGRILTADRLDAHNTVDAPSRVQPAPFSGATLRGSALEVKLPPRSVVVLALTPGSPEGRAR